MIYESEMGLMPPPKKKYWIAGIILFLFIATIVLVSYLFVGPFYFKVAPDQKTGGVFVEVKKGMGAMQIAEELKNKGIISSVSLFGAVVSIFGDSRHIVSGVYLFKKPLGVLQAESRIAHGEFGFTPIKITIPEGFTLKQVEERLATNIPFFNKDEFHGFASTSEGYLFPETYFFIPGISEEKILDSMKAMFDSQTKDVMKDLATSKRSLKDIVIMASILEKEVQSPEDMQIVSGILWKRISMKMALQVDATLNYERGLTSAELTTDDLKKDSPYNTYTNRGLPPTPIDNPGLNAIIASIKPKTNPYLYFLTAKDGKVYYAKTFEEHIKNKQKYL